MKLIHSDIKHGTVKIKTESMDDLYVLSRILDEGDKVKARTIRKIKIGSEEERKKSIIKKPVTLVIVVEKVDFSKYSTILKISGKIAEEHEDIAKGSYHTFNVEDNSILTITKEKWMGFQLEKLREASKAKYPGSLLIILDREEAIFALIEKYGYKILSEIKGDAQKKRYLTQQRENFFEKITGSIKEYAERFPKARIIIASPAFWKEEVFELLDDELKSKTVLAVCSSADTTAIDEVLKRPEIKTTLKDTKIHEELCIVNRLLTEISKSNLGVYGIKETEYYASIGAIDTLLITDGLIIKSRQENKYTIIEELMKNVESMKGRVAIISSENPPGKNLDALGGIGAILRYRA